MSTLQTSNLISNGTLTANTLTVGTTTMNSTSIDFGNAHITPSSIYVGDASVNNILQATVSEPSITVNNQVVTFPSEYVNVQIFEANGNWTKPSWAAAVGAANTSADLVIVHLWGAGGGGNTSIGGGGGGGAFVYGIYMSTQVNSTANVTVGIGGSAGQVGGSSIFGNSISFDTVNRTLTAYGGGSATTTRGGGGGGWLSAGITAGNGGGPLGGTSTSNSSTFGGGYPATDGSGSSIYGGGGGSITLGSPGGASIYGGGGGTYNGTVGTSVYGGFGGNSTVAPTAPGGGGASLTNTTGANGKVIVYTLRKIS